MFLLAAEGVTVPFVKPLLSAHVFIGAMLVPPVALKLVSTGYRFARYYTGDPRYRAAGPSAPLLRADGPVVVTTSVALLASGIALVAVGPGQAHALLAIHKASFVVWFAAMTVHVIGHLLRAPALALADLRRSPSSDGRDVAGTALRHWLIVASLVAGIAIGAYAVSQIGSWYSRDSVHGHGEGQARLAGSPSTH